MPLYSAIQRLSTQPLWVLVLTSLGFLSFLKHAICFLNWVFTTFLRPSKNLNHYGSWALVTGATDGIGRAIAFELARKGLNLVLLGRSHAKIDRVTTEIRSEFPGTAIKALVLDMFAEDAEAGFRHVEEAARDVDVGLLVNCAGVTYPAARFFHEVEEEVWMNVVRVNLEGTTRVTRAVIPGMLLRKRGAVVNIGSGAATAVPSHPLYAVYAATKAYVDKLSTCLYMEYGCLGISVQCQAPLYVATKMACEVASVKSSSLFVPSPQKYAIAAIDHIGYQARCSPYWAHSIQGFLVRLLPDTVIDAWRLSIGIKRRGNLGTH